MPLESIEVEAVVPAPPLRVYNAWLSTNEHSAMTGTRSQCSPLVGGSFSASDGYISGHNIELAQGRRIVQAWRTTEFPEGSADSRLELDLTEVEGGTKIKLRQTDIPEGQGESYRQGWADYYFEPMTRYFSENPTAPTVPAAELHAATPAAPKKAPAKKAAAREAPAKKAAARKAPAKKAPARKAAATKTAARKAPAKKAPARKAAAKKAPARKAAARKAPAKKATAKRKATARKATKRTSTQRASRRGSRSAGRK